jgi:serine protease Do
MVTSCAVEIGQPDATTPDAGTLRDTPSLAPVEAGDEPVADVVARVLPAVVSVTTDVFRTDEFGNAQEGQGVGTGFIIRADGVIVTNCHVVEGASKITVATSAAEPDRYQARVIGGDCAADLAVLDVDAEGLPTVPLGDSAGLALGQRVVALGYALALEGGPTVTTGIVSSLDRTVQAQDPQCPPEACADGVRTYSSVVQTDAAINHGNSGGPLVDMAGRVVGINSAGSDDAENIGFAIAIDSVKDPIQIALDDPLAPSAYLGVSTRAVDGTLAYQLGLSVDEGAYVLATTQDGPASDADIREGDVIVGIGDESVTSSEQMGDVLAGLTAGDEVGVTVVRGDERLTLTVRLGERPLPIELP